MVRLGLLSFKASSVGFSNEAGLGSAPIAHAASKTNSPVTQGSIAMLGTFIDTFVVCTMTALVVITTYSKELFGMSDSARKALAGSEISIEAFGLGVSGAKDNVNSLA